MSLPFPRLVSRLNSLRLMCPVCRYNHVAKITHSIRVIIQDVSMSCVGIQASVLDPQFPFSCLSVLLTAFQLSNPWQKTQGVPVVEIFLQLATEVLTRDSILELLRKVEVLPAQLRALGAGLQKQVCFASASVDPRSNKTSATSYAVADSLLFI